MPALTISDISVLSVKERIQLVEDVWDSIAVMPDELPITPGQRAELDNRLDTLQKKPQAESAWEDVRKRLCRPE